MWTLFLIIYFSIPLLPSLVLYLWKLSKYKNSGLMLLSIYALQAVLMTPIFITINSSPAPGLAGLGILAFFMGISFIVNITLCLVLYFLCINPDPQRRKRIIISVLFVFLVLLLLLFSDKILTKYNFKNNINLYGRLENFDGSPVKNATIYFRTMRDLHFKENPIMTNEKGIFNIQGRSQGRTFLQINKLYDSESGADCNLRFRPSFYSIGNEHTMANIVSETSENNPLLALCWHDFPDDMAVQSSGFVFDMNIDQKKHQLVLHKTVTSQHTIFLPYGKAKSINFSHDGDDWKSNKNPGNEMEVMFYKEKGYNRVRLSLIMNGAGGLLITKQSQYMYKAPESGYKREYNLGFFPDRPTNYSEIIYFYVKLGREGKFGKVRLEITPNFKNLIKGKITFHYQTNLERPRVYNIE